VNLDQEVRHGAMVGHRTGVDHPEEHRAGTYSPFVGTATYRIRVCAD
jgi:hypothetical protein